MAKKLNFTWTISEEVNNKEEITEQKIQDQINTLNYMLDSLQNQINNNLYNVFIDNNYITKCSGEYISSRGKTYHTINNRMTITISKKGRKSTWDDVIDVVNSLKAAKYNFI